MARIPAVDIARSAALLAMAVFHFTFDLEMFGYVAPLTTVTGGWALFSRAIAGTFIFLAGVSLWLGHGQEIRWGAFLRRLGVLALAALAVSAGSYAFAPDRFIFFGILHSIAVSSVIGLLFLRLPAAVTALAALGVFVVAAAVHLPAFDPKWLVWTGLGARTPATMDFEPVFPWLAPCLLGIACAKAASAAGLWDRIGRLGRSAAGRRLGWAGRHSLAIYLVHQPVLVALVAAYAWADGRL